MVQHLRTHSSAEPLCNMTGGAGWKMAPSMSVPFGLVDNLIFDGLLQMACRRFPHSDHWPAGPPSIAMR
jgi:type III pantothenate kinase